MRHHPPVSSASSAGVQQECPTTLMINDITCRARSREVLELIDSLGFVNTYDFFYLPQRQALRKKSYPASHYGYAFINFKSSRYSEMFMHVLETTSVRLRASEKSLYARFARVQGVANLRALLTHSRKKNDLLQPWFEVTADGKQLLEHGGSASEDPDASGSATGDPGPPNISELQEHLAFTLSQENAQRDQKTYTQMMHTHPDGATVQKNFETAGAVPVIYKPITTVMQAAIRDAACGLHEARGLATPTARSDFALTGLDLPIGMDYYSKSDSVDMQRLLYHYAKGTVPCVAPDKYSQVSSKAPMLIPIDAAYFAAEPRGAGQEAFMQDASPPRTSAVVRQAHPSYYEQVFSRETFG
eukprot:TRINITY_DN57787_c0_g2_i1.p1 TRINITY_DN57787_c0_g2~~TRINITY_DN57787_c0_g2_i1.p1  ORF type:complete len:358 (-),score=54.04 TRINITY_DN57787_c0_g2_i1:182-1255(-)